MPDFKTLSMAHGHPRILAPLHPSVQPSELGDADLCSIDSLGRTVPLSDSLSFCGIVDGIGKEHGHSTVSAVIHDFLLVRLDGLSPAIPPGATIFALRRAETEVFSLRPPGAEIGQLLSIKDLVPGTALIVIRGNPGHRGLRTSAHSTEKGEQPTW